MTYILTLKVQLWLTIMALKADNKVNIAVFNAVINLRP